MYAYGLILSRSIVNANVVFGELYRPPMSRLHTLAVVPFLGWKYFQIGNNQNTGNWYYAPVAVAAAACMETMSIAVEQADETSELIVQVVQGVAATGLWLTAGLIAVADTADNQETTLDFYQTAGVGIATCGALGAYIAFMKNRFPF